jgi:hypothetical protein
VKVARALWLKRMTSWAHGRLVFVDESGEEKKDPYPREAMRDDGYRLPPPGIGAADDDLIVRVRGQPLHDRGLRPDIAVFTACRGAQRQDVGVLHTP